MKILNLALLVGGGVALLAGAPLATTSAQTLQPVVAPMHRDMTLGQREDWLSQRIDRSRDNGALDHSEYDRVRAALHHIRQDENAMRDRQDGQLTASQTSDLEARLDNVASRIHWANQTNLDLPW
ncbi:MAG: hypothetical protein ACREEB_03110 [Caulobacteraceae bacterium]